MICYLFFYKRKVYQGNLKFEPLLLYTLFLLISLLVKIISGGITGVDEVFPLGIDLLAYFLLCYIAYFSIDKIVVNFTNIKAIFLLLCIICIINDIVTYLQYAGNELGIIMSMMFSAIEEDNFENIANNLDRIDDVQLAMPGIFGHGAVNGYMTSTLGILSMYYFVGNGKTHWKLGIILYFVSLVGVFCCQERSGFGLFLVFSLLTFWRFSSRLFKQSIPIVLFLGFVACYYFFSDLLFSQDIGRYTELTKIGDNRSKLITNALEFISNNLLLGGNVLYGNLYGLTPHNVILHALIYSGIFGALIVLYLTFYMLRDAYLTIRRSKTGTLAYFFACALTIYLLNGLFHSSSLVTGDIIIWILYSCMLRSNQLIRQLNRL